MICKKCGEIIPDESTFCFHCGCDLRKAISSNHTSSSEEQIPLMMLICQITKHKILVIVLLLVVAIGVGGYVAYTKHQEKKRAETELINEISHMVEIIGIYKSVSGYEEIELELSADNTAKLTINVGSYNEKVRRGYWKEKIEGYPIEIDFSDSFEITIGSKSRSYCRSLYFFNNRIWESMSAIRSYDYSASISMSKQ